MMMVMMMMMECRTNFNESARRFLKP